MQHPQTFAVLCLSLWVQTMLLAVQATPSAQASPAQAQSGSCKTTLLAVRSRLAQIKNVTVTHVDQFDRSKLYSDFPVGRPMSYNFRLKGRGAEAVMQSPKFLAGLSQRLITDCASVGAAQYGVDETDWYLTFGLMPNGQIKAFECVEPAPELKLKWGYQICL